MSQETESEKTLAAVVVGADVFQALMNTLAARPYAEVAQLINALQQSQPIYAEDQPSSLAPEFAADPAPTKRAKAPKGATPSAK